MKSEISTRAAPLIACLLALATLVPNGRACSPESYFLFRAEALERLDSLNARVSADNAVERLVLMHNLAFHKDKERREAAEKLLDKHFPRDKKSPLVKAYAGSLKIIKVSHRSSGSKVIRTINPFTQSPLAEAREGYRQISAAVGQDSADTVVRFIRATAAAQSAEYLHELFDSAAIDLRWLEEHGNPDDSVQQFFIHLNWTRYYFQRQRHESTDGGLAEAEVHADRALEFACTPVFRLWAEQWRSRIAHARGELEPAKP